MGPLATESPCISMYARKNRCYNERGSRTNYIRCSIRHCIRICLHFTIFSPDVSVRNNECLLLSVLLLEIIIFTLCIMGTFNSSTDEMKART